MSNPIKVPHGHKPLLKVSQLTFGYTRTKNELHGLSFDIHEGEWTTIIGPNGSGKSTIAKLVARINKPRAGDVLINNQSISSMTSKSYARLVAYVPQATETPEGISAHDFVGFGRAPWHPLIWRMNHHDRQIINESLKLVGAYDFKDKLLAELSGGERQKVYIAMALAQDTKVIILDEPTTYLDIKAQYEILELLNRLHLRGKTIVTILHDINQAVQYSDEIVIIKAGKLYVQGNPAAVINEEMLANVYGVRADLVANGIRKYLMNIRLAQTPSNHE